eukprot:TRINITY_DN35130_c0_g1_i1.p1 TRINITY_DN35130_c0_g1~~TRINITY_DN35130_c0_g1_i1.p1  ORF type:complete len:486 (+),score=127.79 TRINITY_DN35130_c0_g1_i1:60-1517(+)
MGAAVAAAALSAGAAADAECSAAPGAAPWLRTSQPELLSEEPRVWLYRGLLTDAACDNLIAAAEERGLSRSYENVPEGRRRHSTAAFLTIDQEQRLGVVRALKRFAATELKLPLSHLERLQVQRYAADGEQHYRPHYDSSGPPGTRRRVGAFLFYLRQPEAGGETIFPLISANGSGRPHWSRVPSTDGDGADGDVPLEGFREMCSAESGAMRVAPRRGDALLFFSMEPSGQRVSPLSLHGSCPVAAGEKWVSQQWFRESPVDLLALPALVGSWGFANAAPGEPARPEAPGSAPPLLSEDAAAGGQRHCATVDLSAAAVSGGAAVIFWVVLAACQHSATVDLAAGDGAPLLRVGVGRCQAGLKVPGPTPAAGLSRGAKPPVLRQALPAGAPVLVAAGVAPPPRPPGGPASAEPPAGWAAARWLVVNETGARSEQPGPTAAPAPAALRASRLCVEAAGPGRAQLGRLMLFARDITPEEVAEAVRLGS